MKLLGLDLGDQWIGSALSDASGTLAKPYRTVPLANLKPFLNDILLQEKIKTVIIGNPITLRGTMSTQTLKVKEFYDQVMKEFPHISFILWDERLSSKRAEETKKTRTQEQRLQSHSIAAAFILQSYLDYLQFNKN